MPITKRDKNRKQEHEPHGWIRSTALVEPTTEVFMRCPCGWFGWVSKEVVENEEK